MNFGFDAKRAYHNGTGLGHYSRNLLNSFAEFYPEHSYYLFNPKKSTRFELKSPHFHEINPAGFFSKLFSSVWRSSGLKKDLKRLKIDLYHGLSHEIPFGMPETGIPSVVTIHDLIHERSPEQYHLVDVKIYHKKFLYACENADKIIAISEQTKRDIIEFYKIPEGKIRVCYQSCNPAFSQTVSEDEKDRVRKKYGLPEKYFLYVGSIIERKNLLNIAKALFILRNELKVPLVVIGDGKKYKQQVKDFIGQNNLEDRVIFLSEKKEARAAEGFKTAVDFPAIYQSAIAMIYPSFFEGFGIPVLEALWSKLPVITSNVSCLPEAGGNAAYYVNPASAEDIAKGMRLISGDEGLRNKMKEEGWEHARKFAREKTTERIMNVYNEILKK